MMNEGTTFGGWLKQRRNELGLTQDQLAERLSISHVMLWKIEAGERRPSSQIAGMLADYFRIPNDEREAFVVFARAGRTAAAANAPVPSAANLRSPWRATYAHQTNLPTSLTPLIGRDSEVEAIHDQIVHKTRLLTLTGSPGIGKTRLALQVASGLTGHFDDGVYFVELAPISDPELVLPTIARTLGVRELGGQGIGDLLRQHVQAMRMLLVLDNFEQVLDAAPTIVWLMEASPWLKVLATSREALHVRAERRFPVPPLALPDLTQARNLRDLAVYPSVELFVERAQAVQPDFTLTRENARNVAYICTRLEGLPLAIELAAARAGLLSPEVMLTRLEHRLNLLTGGPRDLPERQRTLRGTIEWSYDLLNGSEQRLFAQLAVFVGGCAVQAVEAVWNAGRELEADVDILAGLHSLVDKSLLSVSEGPRQKEGAGAGIEPRFTMLEMISEYAFERLRESGELRVAQEQHARYFLRLVEETEPKLRGHRQIALLDKLEMEHDNIRAALRWALESKSSALGLRLVGSLRWFWTQRSHYAEGLRWARAVLAMPDTKVRNAARAKALWCAGVLAWLQGDAEARAFLEESVSIWREVGGHHGLGHSLLILGLTVLQQGQPEIARSLEIESVEMFRAVGDKSGVALALGALSNATLALEDAGATNYSVDYEELKVLLDEAIQLAREAGDKWSLALELRNLGWVAMRQGDYAKARPLIEESLALQWETGTKYEAAASIGDLAKLAQLGGDLGEAMELYQRSLGLYKECVDRPGVVSSMAGIGGVALLMGDIRRATEMLTEALQIVKEAPGTRHSTALLEATGSLMAALGRPTRAAVLMSAAQSLYGAYAPARPAATQVGHNRYLESARSQIGEAAWNQAWAKGKAMSREEALEFASESLESEGA